MKFFNRARRGRLEVQCLGKLPLAKDFLRTRDPGAGQAYQAWINHIDQLSGVPASLPASQKIVFVPKDGRDCVVGTIWDSSDQGNVRPFPFTLYVVIKIEDVQRMKQPLVDLEEIWSGLDAEYRAIKDASSQSDFYESLREIDLAPALSRGIASGAEARGSLTGIQIADAIFDEQALDQWSRFLFQIRLALGSEGLDEPGNARTKSFWLPLGKGLSYSRQAESWTRFFQVWGQANALLPSVFFPADEETDNPLLAVVFRALHSSDVHLLRAQEKGHADVHDFRLSVVNSRLRPAEPSYSAFDRRLREWIELGDEGRSLCGFLPSPSVGFQGSS